MSEAIHAEAVYAAGFEGTVSDVLAPASEAIQAVVFYSVSVLGMELPLVVVWLVIASTFFTIYLKFINVRGFRHGFDLVRGRYTRPDEAGEVSHFQALATALSGTVGLGNIAGVAIAISIGGPGAAFWMVLAGFLGMASKMAECTLGVKFRNEHDDGTVSGGPMYFLSKGVSRVTGSGALGKTLAVLFAVCTIGGTLGACLFQTNQATAQIIEASGGDDSPLQGLSVLVGLAIALVAGAVIIGGIRSIARVTEKLVPFMAVLYLVAGAVVLATNASRIGPALGEIITGAFNPSGVAGGIVGALIVGFQRAAYSSEAGVGSASIAHSAVRTKNPATEGHVALLEPFIDTVIVCSTTALVIVVTGTWQTEGDPEAIGGVTLSSSAFATVLPWFPVVLAAAVVLFGFSTTLAWIYYGMKSVGYLFGDNPRAETVVKVAALFFIVFGAVIAIEPAIGIADSMLFLMSVPNVIGLYILAPTLRRELAQYREKIRTGEITRIT